MVITASNFETKCSVSLLKLMLWYIRPQLTLVAKRASMKLSLLTYDAYNTFVLESGVFLQAKLTNALIIACW